MAFFSRQAGLAGYDALLSDAAPAGGGGAAPH
jgi:hypothetical protein